MDWKKLVLLVATVLIPVLYQLGIKNNPSFPLNDSQFFDTVMWIIKAICGITAGYVLKAFSVDWALTKKIGKNYVEFIKDKTYDRS